MAQSETEQRARTEAPAAAVSGVTLGQMLATVKGPTLADVMRSIDVWPADGIAQAARLSLSQQLSAALGIQSAADRLSDLLKPSNALDRLLAGNQRQVIAAFEALNIPPRWLWPEVEPQPRRRPYVPEPEQPPGAIEAVQVDSQITLEGLSHALAEGRLPVQDVMRLCLQHVPASKPGVKEPPIEEQLALVEGWYMVKAARGRKRSFWEEWETQDKYCKKMGISRATLNRYERTCRALGLI